MATANPFDLLVDDDNDDPNQLLAKLPVVKKAPAPAAAAPPAAKLPSRPLPPAQAVREGNSDGQRGGGRFGGRGAGRGRGGGRGYPRDSANQELIPNDNNNGYSREYKPEDGGRDTERFSERRGGGYGPPRGGGRRGGYGAPRDGNNDDSADGERPRRVYDRRSGTGRGNEFVKREGSGRGNWGTPSDDIAPETEETIKETAKDVVEDERKGQEDAGDADKENAVKEPEQKEPEPIEMTLEEYEKVLEEKRKVLITLKSEERKVGLDKELEKMQLLSNKKKNDDEIFIKLGSEKDKRKDAAEKEEKSKKSLSINEFLKPAEGEKYYGGGRGRGRGSRGGYGGGNAVGGTRLVSIKIEDVGQFPLLGAK